MQFCIFYFNWIFSLFFIIFWTLFFITYNITCNQIHSIFNYGINHWPQNEETWGSDEGKIGSKRHHDQVWRSNHITSTEFQLHGFIASCLSKYCQTRLKNMGNSFEYQHILSSMVPLKSWLISPVFGGSWFVCMKVQVGSSQNVYLQSGDSSYNMYL